MTLVPGNGWILDGRAVATTAASEYFADTGIVLSHLFQGDSLTEKLTGAITLVQADTASFDELVVDTLDAPGKLHSHAYEGNTANDAWNSDGTIIPGDGSFMLHVSGFGPVVPAGIVDVAGNEDATNGVSIQISNAGNLIANVRLGAGATPLSIAGSAVANTWWEAVLIADRPQGGSGTLFFGTIDTLMSIALGAGDLASSRAFSIFKGRVTGFVGQVMGVRIAIGDQLIGRGKDAKLIAQATGKRIWWDDEFTRVTSPPK